MDRETLTNGLTTRWVGQHVQTWDLLESTNLYLKNRLAIEEVPAGAAVLADGQTAGRGRLGRTWYSPPGSGLYTSFVFYPPPARLGGILSLLAAVALVDAVRRASGLAARVKWPNDLIIGGNKCAGILVEAGFDPRPWAIMGIGVNVNGKPPGDVDHATTLAKEAGRPLARETLWRYLAQSLEQYYETWLAGSNAVVVDQWMRVSATLGQQVAVWSGGQKIAAGRAKTIDEEGGLWLIGEDGRETRVVAGEVSVRLADGRYA